MSLLTKEQINKATDSELEILSYEHIMDSEQKNAYININGAVYFLGTAPWRPTYIPNDWWTFIKIMCGIGCNFPLLMEHATEVGLYTVKFSKPSELTSFDLYASASDTNIFKATVKAALYLMIEIEKEKSNG